MWLVEVCSWDALSPQDTPYRPMIFSHRHWTINRKPFECHFTGSSLVREEYSKTFTAALVGITTSIANIHSREPKYRLSRWLRWMASVPVNCLCFCEQVKAVITPRVGFITFFGKYYVKEALSEHEIAAQLPLCVLPGPQPLCGS